MGPGRARRRRTSAKALLGHFPAVDPLSESTFDPLSRGRSDFLSAGKGSVAGASDVDAAGVIWRRRAPYISTRVSGSPVWSSHQNQRTATQHEQLRDCSVRPNRSRRVRAKNIAKFDCQNNELFGWRGTGKFTGTYGVFEPVKHRGSRDTRAGIIRFEPYSTAVR